MIEIRNLASAEPRERTLEPNHGAATVPPRFSLEAERQGCLCYVERVAGGWQKHYPDACPLHGWRPEPTPERLAQCAREKESCRKDTDDFINFIAAR